MKQLLYIFFTVLICSPLYSNNINWSSSPTVLSGTNINASDPQVAIDANGNTVAAWVESNLVKSSTKSVNGNWSSAVTVSATGASSPRLVSDSNGNATLVWAENGIIKAASKTLNGSWISSIALSSSGATFPTTCVDNAGDVIVAWARAGNIETTTKLAGMSWQTKSIIQSTSAATPTVAIGGSGANTKVIIVWQGVSNGVNVIYSATKLLASTWPTAQVVSETTHQSAQPSVAIDNNGNALAIWFAYDATSSIYSNVVVKSTGRAFADSNWNAISTLSAPGVRNPSKLVARVAFDKIGNAIALWNTSYNDETFNIESAVKPVNGNWSSSISLVNSNLYAYALDLSPTAFGDVLSLYMFYNGVSLMIQSIESDINGFLNNVWSVPITISLNSKNAYPKIAATLTGNVIKTASVWVSYNGTYNTIVASTGSKTLVLPPTNLSVTQNVNNFGVFSEYYNTLSWQASSDSKVVGYLIFRNGTFIGQVAANVLQFIDDNRNSGDSVTYSVTAIDSQQTQSTTISVNFP